LIRSGAIRAFRNFVGNNSAPRDSTSTCTRFAYDPLFKLDLRRILPKNGSALFLSEGTVKSHVKAIFAKMNVISRTEAVANATRRGLIQL
jgi:two-component system NarL family response regulator